MSDDRLIELVRAVRAAYYDGLAEGRERARGEAEAEIDALRRRLDAALKREDDLRDLVDEAHAEIERLRARRAS